MDKITLSVVIPAYQERERIGPNLTEIGTYLGAKNITYEVIVVVDGSHDQTAQYSRSFADQVDNLQVVENEKNRGKGFVIRQGLMLAKGTYHVFLDADGSTSISHIDAALEMIDAGADFVLGSRSMPESVIAVHQPRYREIMGTIGNIAIRVVLGLWRFSDTQCGFKVMRAEVSRAVVPRMVVDRFAYDFEMIVLTQKLGFKIEQIPVRWVNEEGTTVGGLFGPNGFVRVLYDLACTRVRLWMGTYNL